MTNALVSSMMRLSWRQPGYLATTRLDQGNLLSYLPVDTSMQFSYTVQYDLAARFPLNSTNIGVEDPGHVSS